jgi:membrane-bound lytic murein transglycosylase D
MFIVFYTILCIPKQLQAVVTIECATNFPCPEELKPKIQFWVKVFQEYSKNQAIFHDTDNPEVIYSVITSDTYCGQGRKGSPIELERNRIKGLLNSIQTKQMLTGGATYSTEESAILDQIKISKGFEISDAGDRVRCQNGVRDQFEKALSRYRYYRNDVIQILKESNLPEEIQYLPFVESSYNPLAYSKVGAAGLWQIMPKTARVLGLKINASIDERLDPILATKGAARYFETSYQTMTQTASNRGYNSQIDVLGPFVITSYNYGIAGMKRALESHGTDFMNMLNNYKGKSFRVAVKNFYASFLAAKHIVTNENKYFQGVETYQMPPFQVLSIPKAISATKFSDKFNLSIDSLRELNPVLTKRVWAGTQPVPQNFQLKIPKGDSVDAISKKIAAMSVDEIGVKIKNYKVERGDALCNIARSFNVSCSDLMQANGLSGKAMIRVGQNLVIPSKEPKMVVAKSTPSKPAFETSQQSILVLDEKPASTKTEPDAAAPPIPAPQTPVIETPLQSVASIVSPPPPAVVAPQPIPENQPIVAGSGDFIASNNDWLLVQKIDEKTPKYFIHVESEETLGHYSDWIEGSTTQSLRNLNGIPFSNTLTVGKKIYLPIQSEDQKRVFEKKRVEYHQTLEEGFDERYKVIAFTTYQVKRGDNEWSISDKLQIPMWLIKKYNPMLAQKPIRAGDMLTVPLLKEQTSEPSTTQDLPVVND